MSLKGSLELPGVSKAHPSLLYRLLRVEGCIASAWQIVVVRNAPITASFASSLPRFLPSFPSITFTKMYVFINMVITHVKNWSPDMILTPFDRKFDEKKYEIPPGICRPHIFEIFQYWKCEC